MADHVEEHIKEVKKTDEIPMGYSDIDIEGRFTRLRSQETNMGNL
jgi:hypothetical protein